MGCGSRWLERIENLHEVLKSNLRVASFRSRYRQVEVSMTQLREFRALVLRIKYSAYFTSRLLLPRKGKALGNLLINELDFPLQNSGNRIA